MKVRLLVSYFLFFLISLTLTISCADSPQNKPSLTTIQNNQLINLGFSAWPGWFPWQVAQEKDIFQKNNANVNLKWFDNYAESIKSLNQQKLNANNQTLGDTVLSKLKGHQNVIVLVTDYSTGNDKIIAREGIKSIAQLKGQKVAAEEGAVDHFLLLLAMQRVGLTKEEITFVPMETSKAATAFLKGEVDAVAVFAPFTTEALKRLGSSEIFSSRDIPGVIADTLAFTGQFVEQHPSEVQTLVDAWFATLDYIQENKLEAYKIMANRAGVSLAEYKEYDKGTKILSIEDNMRVFQKGHDLTSLHFAAEQAGEFFVNVGLAKKTTDTNTIFDDRFVKAYYEKNKKS